MSFPLTLQIFTGYLVKDVADQNWDWIAQDADLVKNTAERIIRLIEDLLAFSRAANDELQVPSVGLSGFCISFNKTCNTRLMKNARS